MYKLFIAIEIQYKNTYYSTCIQVLININILGGIDDVIVPEKLLPYFGLAKNPLRLKANVDFSKYDRLFNIDESLKPVSFLTLPLK